MTCVWVAPSVASVLSIDEMPWVISELAVEMSVCWVLVVERQTPQLTEHRVAFSESLEALIVGVGRGRRRFAGEISVVTFVLDADDESPGPNRPTSVR